MPKLHKPILSILSLSLALTPVIGAAPDRWGSYDFAYQSTGDVRVKPVQVFDDGRTTFFQFRSGEAVPAIFAETPGGPMLLMPVSEGPYVKVPSTPRTFLLKMGQASSRVTYANAPRIEAAPMVAALPPQALVAESAAVPVVTAATRQQGSVGTSLSKVVGTEGPVVAAPLLQVALAPAQAQPATPPAGLLAANQPIQGLPSEIFRQPPPRPSLERDSYSTPIRGDLVEWNDAAEQVKEIPLAFPTDGSKLNTAVAKAVKAVVQNANASTRFEVVGHDDGGLKEKVAETRAATVVSALISAGAARWAISSRVSAGTREISKGQWVGATLRVIDVPKPKSTASMPSNAAAIDVSYVAQRLRAGEISPSEAVSLLQKANQAAAVLPRLSPVPPIWFVRKSDETVERMLGRWTREAGWRLVWLSAPAIPVIGDSQITRPDLVQAVDYVISQMRASGHQIQATAYLGNRTLVVKGE